MSIVRLKKIFKTSSGSFNLDVEFDIQGGEFVTLFGKSGSGKTTILKLICGLIQPDEGYIELDGEVWYDSRQGKNLPIQKRLVGFVLQGDSLFPHMTVRENLQFALTHKKDESLLDELLEMVQLKSVASLKPEKLSGGQKQRVALIRSILRKPKIFLWDEPFSSLDIALKLQLQEEILKMYQRFGITTLFVSHDLAEVFKLSSRIFVLEGGKITKSGKPPEVFVKQNISGKFRFIGEVVEILKEDIVYILTIKIGQNISKVVATTKEVENIKIGDKIMVSTKAFNPLILKYNE